MIPALHPWWFPLGNSRCYDLLLQQTATAALDKIRLLVDLVGAVGHRAGQRLQHHRSDPFAAHHALDLAAVQFTQMLAGHIRAAAAQQEFLLAHEGLDASQHTVANHQVIVDGDRANAIAYVVARLIRNVPEGGVNYWEFGGWYDDSLVRIAYVKRPGLSLADALEREPAADELPIAGQFRRMSAASGQSIPALVALLRRPNPPIVDAERKAEILSQIAAQEKIDLSQTVAIGDGANDLPMLQAAGLGVAYHAKPRTRAAASAGITNGDLTTILYAMGYPRSQWVA